KGSLGSGAAAPQTPALFTNATPASLRISFGLSSLAWGDYDNDGRLDLLLTGATGGGNVSRLFHNDGNGAFHNATPPGPAGVSSRSAAWGDYDNDGRLDLLLTGDTGSGFLSRLFHNDGGGAFHDATPAGLPAVSISSAAWGDYDNDGRLD